MNRYLPKLSKKIKAVFFIFLFGLSLTILTPQLSQAQSPESTTIVAIPPKKGDNEEVLRVIPGEKFQTTIRVRNTSDKTLVLESIVKDFIVAEDGFTPIEVSETVSSRWSLAKWMTIAPNTNKLGPGEIAQISVLIETPEDALPGGHYAMVLHKPIGSALETIDASGTDSATAISQQVGTLFYVIVDGPINEAAFIRGLNFKKFSEFGPVPYSYMVENQSDIHIKAKTKIDIYNLLGIKVGTIVPNAKNIFPMMSRNFEGQWDRKWGFGRYTAKLVMSYGDLGQVALASTKFWIVPIRLIIIILTIFILVSIFITIRKKKKARQEKLATEQIKDLEKKIEHLENDKSVVK